MNEHPFNCSTHSVLGTVSSIYSRTTDLESLVESERQQNTLNHNQTTNNNTPWESPEINRVDHAIQMAQGATIALETMPSWLKAAKLHKVQSQNERKVELEQELQRHQEENNFYGICYDIYRALHEEVTTISRELLQYNIVPESFLLDSIWMLNRALRKSQESESRAEAEWMRYWNIHDSPGARTTWI